MKIDKKNNKENQLTIHLNQLLLYGEKNFFKRSEFHKLNNFCKFVDLLKID